MTILIVEDNEISSEILHLSLKQQGHETVVARTGKQALAALRTISGFGLVITDIEMPEMNGLQFLEEMRTVPAWRKIPVILCTAVAGGDTIRRAAMLGCRHFLIKPFQKWMLLQKVAEALGDEKPVLVEPNQVRQRLGLDEEAFDKVYRTFTQTVAEQLRLLDAKLHDPNSSGTSISLSRLAEGANTLGAERLGRLLGRLQTQAAQSVLVASDFESLYQEMKLVSEALRSAADRPSPASQPH